MTLSLMRLSGDAEIASTGKWEYGKRKYKAGHFASLENATTENSDRIGGKRNYGKRKYLEYCLLSS